MDQSPNLWSPTDFKTVPVAQEVPEQGLGEDQEGERLRVGGGGGRKKVEVTDPGRGNLLPRLSLSQRTSQIKISLNVNENFYII